MTYLPPYASKMLDDGRKLFARNTGIKATLSQGANTITYNATYEWAKITAIEVINCEALDTASLKVYTANDILLNQFSYDLNLPKDFYRRASKFDADLVKGLKIVIEYNSVSAKTIGINFIMDEAK